MSYPNQKRYTLDEAAQHIEKETGETHSSNSLLQMAKNESFGICIFIRDKYLRFIQLDKPENKWHAVRCDPLFTKDTLKKVVIPIDKPNQGSHTTHTIDPQKEEVFPILSNKHLKTLSTFADTNVETASILPCSLLATDSKGLMEIVIIRPAHTADSSDSKYEKWQKENSLLAVSKGGHRYFETWSFMEIKRSDLCVIKSALDGYIQRVLAQRNKPDRIQEAITEIKERTGRAFTKNQLFRKAKNKELFISFSKPYQRYVQMDLKGHENINMDCESLGITIIIPESRKTISDVHEVYKSEEETIFPLLEKHSLIALADLHDTKIRVSQLNISAKDKAGNDLIVTCFYNYKPEKETNEYYHLIEWLKQTDIFYNVIDSDEPDPNNQDYYVLNTFGTFYVACDNLELKETDLYIPDFELDRFINSLKTSNTIKLDEPYYSLDDALIRVKEIAGKTRKKHNLINLAEYGKIKLSVHKPEWKYVQIDRADQEMEIKHCKVLDSNSHYLVVPKAGLIAGTGLKIALYYAGIVTHLELKAGLFIRF